MNSYIIINDINLSIKYNGGRKYFDYMKLQFDQHMIECRGFHFNNSHKSNHYDYYEEYESNNLIIPVPAKLIKYELFDSCASAQMIIKKVK